MSCEIQQTVRDWIERSQRYQAGIRSAGQPPDLEQRIRWAQNAKRYWEQQVRQRQELQQQVQQAVRGLADDYHPFDAHSGQAVCGQQMHQRLQERLQTIERLAQQAEVSEASREKIAKAKRVMPRLVASLEWFWHSLRQLVRSLE